MPLWNINLQPAYNETLSAYRPLDFVVQGDADQTVYCDVYLQGTYHKTLMCNFYDPDWGPTFYRFDVQDAVREFMTTYVHSPNIMPYNIWGGGPGIVSVQCAFRGSWIGTFGEVIPFGPEPVQGTLGVPPISGGAEKWSNQFIAFNGVHQHEGHPVLIEQLHRLKRTHPQTITTYNPNLWGIYPLSDAAEKRVTQKDAGFFTGYIKELGYNGTAIQWTRLYLYAQILGTTTYAWNAYDSGLDLAINHVSMFDIPSAPMTLKGLGGLGGLNPAIWRQMINYFVALRITSGPDSGKICFQTPMHRIERGPVRRVRLWFRNYWGVMEYINFTHYQEDTTATSEIMERPLKTISSASQNSNHVYNKMASGLLRSNTRANEGFKLTDQFNEADGPVLEQLLSSSMVFMEMSRDDIGQYTGNALKPVLVKDGTITKIKVDERYKYEMSCEIYMANENIIPSTGMTFKSSM